MTSLWFDDRTAPTTPPAPPAIDVDSVDVVVVGAGITGLTTAVLLARAGKRVVVVEARRVGAGATGNTTGKVTALQGSRLARISARHSDGVLRAYVAGNREGRDWLLRYCDEHGLAVQRHDDHAYAQRDDGLDTARAVLSACRSAGLDEAHWVARADVPFPFRGGVRLPEQAQLDPVPVLHSLVAELERHGGTLLQGVRATSVSGFSPVRVGVRFGHGDLETERTITAGHCVLATGIPVLDRGLFFARLQANRSYCLAFTVPDDFSTPMFISVDSPTRSIRWAPTGAGERLIVGGAGHPVGRSADPARSVDELSAWAQRHYPGTTRTHFWSAQDYAPAAELPYVGPVLPGMDRILVATGYDKWGLSNGVAAALALSARLLGGRMDWADAFASWPPHLSGAPSAVRSNAEVGFNLVKGWLTPMLRPSAKPREGQGAVTGAPWQLRAESVVDGVHRTVSPVCPHLGGVVRWNDADRAWECPLHGSRFAPDGELLEGPATRGLG